MPSTNKLIDYARLSRFWDKTKAYISSAVAGKQDDMSGGSVRNLDLNDLVETKTYWVNNDNILNAPTNTYGYLEVFAQGTSLRLQRWTTFGSYDVYERYYVNSQWYSWKKISANNIIDTIYPVGSIYMSVTDSTVASVQARFGGTWERISEGKALFGYSTTDSAFQTIGSGGGNKTVNLQHSHGFASNAVVGSTTLTGRQSGIQQHKHSVASNAEYEVSNNGKVTDGITGGGHTHNFSTYIQNAADEAHGYTLVGGGGFYDRCIVTSSINRIYATSNTHKHDLPNHSHTVSLKSGKGLTLNNTGHTNALDSHNHSLSSVTTNSQLSTTQNILNPYITVYMYKRTA